MGVAGSPEVVPPNPVLNAVYEGVDFTLSAGFILALGVVIFGFILISAFFRSLTYYGLNPFHRDALPAQVCL